MVFLDPHYLQLNKHQYQQMALARPGASPYHHCTKCLFALVNHLMGLPFLPSDYFLQYLPGLVCPYPQDNSATHWDGRPGPYSLHPPLQMLHYHLEYARNLPYLIPCHPLDCGCKLLLSLTLHGHHCHQ
ncbi:hypothetical protein GOP47_0015309 [Adiantum capillus-veneris]|uniref:Uncharacterized protein n=1 Tax=Adiantum capillus-veneris TaxID=13818 RepID=A0A9D4ZB55_ADICA|nr:hypothetical protein GOP47_0015309 [Adiantum capillus-veneris]